MISGQEDIVLFNSAMVDSALVCLVPPVAIVFLLWLFWRRTTPSAAFITLLGIYAVSAASGAKGKKPRVKVGHC